MDYSAFLESNLLTPDYLVHAQKWFNPLGDAIAMHQKGAQRPFYVGINGAQGSGKSTLSQYLVEYLSQEKQLSVVALSLDDFYLSKSDRLAMSVKIHPLLKTRGVPGTHDVSLLQKTLKQLGEYGTVSLPKFDKSTDDPYSVLEWPVVNAPVDVVIFEGWCWGAEPQPSTALAYAVNSLEKEHDGLGVWREYVNSALRQQYVPLQNMMNYWVMLKAPDFDCVSTWRLEQENKLRQKVSPEKATTLMDETQVKAFVSYFERLTRHILDTLPERANCVFELDNKRHITGVVAEYMK
ncbi:kinase [Alteromonas facilis]|uniref:kinase n=1 Tax=Alteromonas facilis TaxID=2048004 RepID=UPI000C28D15A|nr:kinase [Alteromonas facilis]